MSKLMIIEFEVKVIFIWITHDYLCLDCLDICSCIFTLHQKIKSMFIVVLNLLHFIMGSVIEI